jgi:hypothetical protein
LEQKTHWQATLFNTPQIKDSRYLRIDVNQIMRELGVSAKTVGPAHSVEAIGEIFGRVMRLAKTYCENIGWGRTTLSGELTQALGLFDEAFDDLLLDEAFACSYQDRVECEKPTGQEDRWITLRYPRLLHAQRLIGESFMVPHGPWCFIGEKDMPRKDERMEWLNKTCNGAPYMVKVKRMSFYKPLETDTFNAMDLIKLGESILPGRQRRQREWMPMPELLYVSKFADVEFDSVCIGTYYDEPVFPKLKEQNYMMHHSYAWGLLAENIWMTYAARTINSKAKSKTVVSPRATWIRSIDRFYSFSAAIQMSLKDVTKVLSYGNGSVTVSCKEQDIGAVIQQAVDAGLQAPASSYIHWRRWHQKEADALAARANQGVPLLEMPQMKTRMDALKEMPLLKPSPNGENHES